MPLLHILDTYCNNRLKTKDHQILNRPFEDTINCEHQLGEACIKKPPPNLEPTILPALSSLTMASKLPPIALQV